MSHEHNHEHSHECCSHDHSHEHNHEHSQEHCCGHEQEHNHESGEITLKQLIISAALFAIALIVDHLPIFSANIEGFAYQTFNSIKLLLFAASYLIVAKNVLIDAIKNIGRGQIFDEQFLMSAASIGAIIIGQYPEAVAVMLFYQIGEYFQDSAVDKSRDSIKSLMELKPDKATVLRNGQAVECKAEEIQIGETIQVHAGERIALDGIVVEGKSFVDTSALTGEAVPREIGEGAAVMAGFVNTSGLLKIKVTSTAGESAAARIIELVENASEKKARAQKFISRFAQVYTPLVCLAAVLVATAVPLASRIVGGALGDIDTSFHTWIYRGLMFLVVSCPCALVISVPLSFFGGIGNAAKHGILIKGSNYIEALAHTKTAVFDKTGTLTKGVFIVNEIHIPQNKISEEELLAIAAHAQKFSEHPISKSLRAAHHCERCDFVELKNLEEIGGQGIRVEIDGKKILAGNMTLMRQNNVAQIVDCDKDDIGTIVHIAIDGIYFGHILISDKEKDEAKNAIAMLKKLGVTKIVMLTGDNALVAQGIAKNLGIDETRAELLPSQKVEAIELLLQEQGKRGSVIFAGDGINDAPVLARADVGIAMGALGSDAAIEAADVVVMNDNPAQIALGVKIARKTMAIVKQNIALSLAVKFAIMALAIPGIANMWLAVFGDVGLALLAVLNALRLSREKIS